MYREKHNSYFNITTTEKIDNSNEYEWELKTLIMNIPGFSELLFYFYFIMQ